MQTPLSPVEIDRVARKRASAKLRWYAHVVIYLVANAAMFAASFYGLRQRPWSVYPALGWGLGVVLHGIAVFVLGAGSELREAMVRKERERLQRQQQGH